MANHSKRMTCCYMALHNHTASLLQLAQHTRQDGIDHLLDLVLLLVLPTMLLLLLLLVWLLVILLAGVLVGVVRRRNGAQIGRTTSQINVDTTGVFLSGVLQAHLATDLFDTGLDFLDMIRGVVSFADDAVLSVRISYFLLSQQPKPGKGKFDRRDGTYTWRWFCPCCVAYLIRSSRISSASSTNWPCRSIVSAATRPFALFSRKINSDACLLYSSILRPCALPCSESSLAAAPSPLV